MKRFSSLEHSPGETRRILRDRFSRYLSVRHTTPNSTRKEVMLLDEVLLQLLLSLTIEFESDFATARVTYVAALPANSSEPSLDELATAGWFRVIWGRISTSFEAVHAARSAPAGTMIAFTVLLGKQYGQAYRLTESARSASDLLEVITAIDQGSLTPRDIGCQTPEWVAARLWDRPLTKATDLSAALRVWVDRWCQLGYPSLIPSHAWNEAAAKSFRETAMHVLKTESGFFAWEEMRDGFIKQMALVSKRPESSVEGYAPPVPATVVDCALWLDKPQFQGAINGTLAGYEDIFCLIGLLLAEVEVEERATAPHKLAGELFELAIEQPEILLAVLRRIRLKPVLLADLVLFPKTSALACLLIAQWQPSSNAWEREMRARDDQTTKAIAFADAVSVMGHFLERGNTRPEEAAALLNWLHSRARPGFIDDLRNSEWMLATLRGELARQSPETLQTMVATFMSSMPEAGLGTSTFAAALDIIDAGTLADAIDPSPLVNAYIESVDVGDYSLSAHRVSVSGAASLLVLAMRAPAEVRKKFFFPVDIRARLSAAASDENKFALTETIVRSIRTHIRILSRAVVGSIEVPGDLADALVAAIRAGALKHDEKGRVAAFAARYESIQLGVQLDRPIASDLGAALSTLNQSHRERLLSAILEIDEPLVLTQLLSFAPHVVRSKVERRITELTPSEAGEITFALYAEEDDIQKVTATVESLVSLLQKSFRP